LRNELKIKRRLIKLDKLDYELSIINDQIKDYYNRISYLKHTNRHAFKMRNKLDLEVSKLRNDV
jgi:phosphomevalonate kinase